MFGADGFHGCCGETVLLIVSSSSRRWLAVLVAVPGLLSFGTAHAADEEIQVYMNEINAPGQPGLDLHTNYVPSGDGSPDYAGGQGSLHRLRVTPEFSYSLDDHFELGAYLPLATLDGTGQVRADGWKVRVKWLGRHPETGFYYGLNYEVGRLDHHLDQNPWNNEIKLIGGWDSEKWIVGANLNFDFALSGPAKATPDLQLATKIGYKLSKTSTIGVESYNGLGTLRDFAHLSQNDHTTFVALDTKLGRWDLNLGLGKGYGTSKDSTIVKLIIGVPIGK